MSKFFLCEIENIEKSGVEIKVTGIRFKKDDDDCIRTVRTVCFDFSEHDKVFEDKIAELEKGIANYKQAFKDKCSDYNAILDNLDKFIFQNEELKKRIAELESRESEKTMRIEFHADNGEMLTTLEVANALINQNTFNVDELRELSEFLQVYCNHHEDRDIEPSIILF